jgi:hypothetical protein
MTIKDIYVASDAGSKNNDNKTSLVIHIDSSIPIIHLNQYQGSGSVSSNSSSAGSIEYNTSMLSETFSDSLSAIEGAPYDEDDDARFKPIAVLNSIVTKNQAFLWYDATTRMILILPDLAPYTVDGFKGKTVDVKGYILNNNRSNTLRTDQFILNDATASIFKEPNEAPTTQTHLLSLPGFEQYSFYNNQGLVTDDKNYLESAVVAPVQMFSLGAIFDSNVNVYPVVPYDVHVSTIGSVISNKPDDVLIPLYI